MEGAMTESPIFESKALWQGDVRDGMLLVQRVTEHLRRMIMEGELPPETQLPNELDLSTQLNVSRSTIRSALAHLEQAGFIQRRWGVGTFVAKNPPTYNNLSINSGVTQLIKSSGEKPGSIEILVTTRPAGERVSSQLSIELGTPTLVVERVRLANDQRVVFTVDYLPLSLFLGPDGDIPLEEIKIYLKEHQSFYDFLFQRLSLEIHHGLAWIQPCSAGDYIAEKLQISSDSNILHLEQVDFDMNGDPVALADEFYVADAFRFYIYRSTQGVLS
jgi:GntR family transcriptional regulator